MPFYSVVEEEEAVDADAEVVEEDAVEVGIYFITTYHNITSIRQNCNLYLLISIMLHFRLRWMWHPITNP